MVSFFRPPPRFADFSTSFENELLPNVENLKKNLCRTKLKFQLYETHGKKQVINEKKPSRLLCKYNKFEWLKKKSLKSVENYSLALFDVLHIMFGLVGVFHYN